MFRPEMGTRLPNTLMLQAAVLRHAKQPEDGAAGELDAVRRMTAERVAAQIELFAEKYRDGIDYSLLSGEQIDAPGLARAMHEIGMLRVPHRSDGSCPITFVSRNGLIESEHVEDPEERWIARKRLIALFERSMRGSMARSLDAAALDRWKTRKLLAGRDLDNLVSLSLGSQRLLAALDTGFGYPFAHVFKDDLVAFWTRYVAHALEGEHDQMTKLEGFARHMRQTFPVARIRRGEPDPMTEADAEEEYWIFMVH